jgi:hypothetical protein
VHLLDYAATHPDAILRYQRSDMVLHIHSDASYLSAPEARSRAGGHHFLSSRPADPTKAPSRQPTNNGSIHAECSVLRNVMASAAEAEIGALYINSQTAEVFRTTLIEMGHPQPPTPVQTDNSTAYGIVNSSIRQRRLIHSPTAIACNGHAILLGTRPRSPKPFPRLLETRSRKPRQLLHQASPAGPPSNHALRISRSNRYSLSK